MNEPPLTEVEQKRQTAHQDLLARVLLAHHFIEGTVRGVLRSALAKPDPWALDTIDEMLSRCSMDWRLQQLRHVLDQRGVATNPLVNDLQELDRIRNVLAHSGPVRMWPGEDPEGTTLFLVGTRPGKHREETLSAPNVEAVLDGAKLADDTIRSLLDN